MLKKNNRGFTPLEKVQTVRKRSSLTGFTLVETMVVLGISSFIIAAMYGTLATGRRSWLVGEALLRVHQEARLGLGKIVRDLRLASSAWVSANNRIVRFNGPIDANSDGFLDLIPGTSTIVYGADDLGDFDVDGVFWEASWNIEYEIDAVNNQIIRRVLTDTGAQASQKLVVRNINPDSAFTFFQTETGGTGIANAAVIINLTTQINTVEGVTISPPLQVTLRNRVNLRN